MGFFDKLFGNGANPEEVSDKIIRAQYKDAGYFKNAIKFKQSNIEMYLQDNAVLQQQGKLQPSNFWMVAMEYLDLVYLHYSAGNSIQSCYDAYLQAASYYEKSWDEEAIYPDMLDMAALGYLLQVPDQVFNSSAVRYIQQSDQSSSYEEWQPDALLWYIVNAKLNTTANIPQQLIYPQLYQEIYAITQLPKQEAEKAMKAYLDKWYTLHKDDPWYENHKKERAYKGYWSWEAGAISKIMGLDDTDYKNHPHYPYDMVSYINNS